MRKFFAMILAITMLATLFVSCGEKQTDKNANNDSNPNQAVADDSFQKIKDKGVFVLGFDENFPPMGFKEGSEYTGFDLSLIHIWCRSKTCSWSIGCFTANMMMLSACQSCFPKHLQVMSSSSGPALMIVHTA